MNLQKSKFEFLEPRLLDIKFHVEPGEQEEVQGETKYSMKVSIDKDTDSQIASVTLFLEATPERGISIGFECAMKSTFRWEKDAFRAEQIESMLNATAPALLLSYMRPIIATLSAASGYPSFHLPFFDLRNANKEMSNNMSVSS